MAKDACKRCEGTGLKLPEAEEGEQLRHRVARATEKCERCEGTGRDVAGARVDDVKERLMTPKGEGEDQAPPEPSTSYAPEEEDDEDADDLSPEEL